MIEMYDSSLLLYALFSVIKDSLCHNCGAAKEKLSSILKKYIDILSLNGYFIVAWHRKTTPEQMIRWA